MQGKGDGSGRTGNQDVNDLAISAPSPKLRVSRAVSPIPTFENEQHRAFLASAIRCLAEVVGDPLLNREAFDVAQPPRLHAGRM